MIIKTWIAEATPRTIRFAYEMRLAADGRKLAAGETLHIFCDRQMKRCRVPAKYYERFGITPPGV